MTNYFGWKGKSPKLEHFLGQENLKIRRWRTGQEQGHEWEFGHGESHSKKTEATSPVCVSERSLKQVAKCGVDGRGEKCEMASRPASSWL